MDSQIKVAMDSFNPFDNNITPAEIASFMSQNFPLVAFDPDKPIKELQKLAQKWIDIATRASGQINNIPSVSVSKPQPLRRKRRDGDADLPTKTGRISAKDRGSGSNKRSRKGAEATEAKDRGIKVNTKPATATPRNNPSRASKSEANSRTTFMYSLTDRQGTRRSSKPSATVKTDSKPKSNTPTNQIRNAKANYPQIDDSSSLTGISDDEDTSARELEELEAGAGKRAATAENLIDGLSDEAFARELEVLESEPLKHAATEESLIEGLSNASNSLDAQFEKDLIDLGPIDVFQLPNVGDLKGGFVEPHLTRPSNTSCTCNIDCRKEIATLKARVQKLEDLTFPQYRIPPPSVVAILEEYKRL